MSTKSRIPSFPFRKQKRSIDNISDPQNTCIPEPKLHFVAQPEIKPFDGAPRVPLEVSPNQRLGDSETQKNLIAPSNHVLETPTVQAPRPRLLPIKKSFKFRKPTVSQANPFPIINNDIQSINNQAPRFQFGAKPQTPAFIFGGTPTFVPSPGFHFQSNQPQIPNFAAPQTPELPLLHAHSRMELLRLSTQIEFLSDKIQELEAVVGSLNFQLSNIIKPAKD